METGSETLTPDRIEEILSMKFGYYRNLKVEDKQKFVERTSTFIGLKEFIPREGIDITAGIDDIKTLISASAIQVTFGLSEFRLDRFSKIFIYPREYYSPITRHYNKGEANLAGALVFSWKDFKSGYEEEVDKVNLGLHEMGHALMLNRVVGQDNDEFFVKYFDKWWSISQTEFFKLEQHERSMFRDYGGTNPNEFFAVCMETFFEAPQEFYEKHPEIYKQTCILLNQDPSGNIRTVSSVRVSILNSNIVTAIPQTLLFKTNGQSIFNTIMSVGVIPGYLFIVAAMSALAAGWGYALIPVILVYLMLKFGSRYQQFYFYDNAFVVGHERLGKEVAEQTVFQPEQMVKVSFEAGSKDTPTILVIYYIENGEMKMIKWDYSYLSEKDIHGLEGSMQAFCGKHKIGYKNAVYPNVRGGVL
jgi:Mlc titration factor MtfA (ptsG expression regulator)